MPELPPSYRPGLSEREQQFFAELHARQMVRTPNAMRANRRIGYAVGLIVSVIVFGGLASILPAWLAFVIGVFAWFVVEFLVARLLVWRDDRKIDKHFRS